MKEDDDPETLELEAELKALQKEKALREKKRELTSKINDLKAEQSTIRQVKNIFKKIMGGE